MVCCKSRATPLKDEEIPHYGPHFGSFALLILEAGFHLRFFLLSSSSALVFNNLRTY